MTEKSQGSGGIPEKYAKLKQAEAAGLLTPKSLLLAFEASVLVDETAIDDFVNSHADSRFIVRSAHLQEDASDLSLAGHFWSSGPVVASELHETIQRAQKENALVLNSLASSEAFAHPSSPHPAGPKLILQAYIEHSIGGVLFSPWSFFPDYAYVEYSESGVKEVVGGQDSINAVLCLDDEYSDPLPMPLEQSSLKQQLVSVCLQLRQLYDFPVDCEWAYESQKQQVIVLQVRPQTHSVGPILLESRLDPRSSAIPRNWQFTALSESLGRLSPLSYSLLKQLYTKSIPMFKALGCKAENVDFMTLAPDGTVLVEPELEAGFYSMTLFGGFKRGIQKSKLASEAESALRQYDCSAKFDYETLQQLFEYWMATNLLSAGAGRNNTETATTLESSHAYELSWPVSLEPPTAPKHDANSDRFVALNSWGRALFLFELNKLKQQLRQSHLAEQRQQQSSNNEKTTQRRPDYRFFADWQTLTKNGMAASKVELTKAYQHKLAPLALYDFALSNDADSADVQVLSSRQSVEGPLHIIKRPAGKKQPIPEGCILVAPYFDNHWVSQIKSLKGIVVNKGSRLSHSAIVAREYDVPYYVVPELGLEQWGQGQRFALDPTTANHFAVKKISP